MGLGRVKRLPVIPLWKGPQEDGITQSMLNTFLVCQERFYIKTILGIKPLEGFPHRLEYGSMWHECEEALASNEDWRGPLRRYAIKLQREYPDDRREIDHWYNVCQAQFPPYIDYWRDHTDVKGRIPLFQEEVFRVPYKLPSGRVVDLRGKFDAADIIKSEKGVFLQENKTKGEINEDQLKSELPNTLQPMFYLLALRTLFREENELWEQDKHLPPVELLGKLVIPKGIPYPFKVRGVRYNVVRRPLSGGRHSIRQKKNQTKSDFYKELSDRISGDPEFFFMRWRVELTNSDIDLFTREVIEPILENVLDWWEWIEFCCAEGACRYNGELRKEKFPHHTPRHFRFPYGLYNVLTEGKHDAMNHYLTTGSMVGMKKVDKLFPELN